MEEITREEAIQELKEIRFNRNARVNGTGEFDAALQYAIEQMEQESKTGHWIKEKTVYGWDGHSYQCSECGRSIHLDPEVENLDDYPYCHCGAKMSEIPTGAEGAIRNDI